MPGQAPPTWRPAPQPTEPQTTPPPPIDDEPLAPVPDDSPVAGCTGKCDELAQQIAALQAKIAELENLEGRVDNLESTSEQLVQSSAALLQLIQQNQEALEPEALARRLPPINFHVFENGELVQEVPRRLGQTLELDWSAGATELQVSN